MRVHVRVHMRGRGREKFPSQDNWLVASPYVHVRVHKIKSLHVAILCVKFMHMHMHTHAHACMETQL